MFPPGTKIKTTQSNGSGDWQPEAHKTRVWGREGLIIGHHDSHGLVYCVAHFRSGMEGGDSTIAYYEPGEFDVITLPVPMDKLHFPISEALICGDRETVSEFQVRTMLHQFVARYKTCTRLEKLDNQKLYAGEPMAGYCEHCGMMCDILPEDFLCLPRTACTPCEQLISLNLMDKAKQCIQSSS